jgi:hypothetical protein
MKVKVPIQSAGKPAFRSTPRKGIYLAAGEKAWAQRMRKRLQVGLLGSVYKKIFRLFPRLFD